MPLSTAHNTLILASGSAGRKTMLDGAGLSYTAIPADINEKSLLAALRAEKHPPEQITLKLAQEKALYVSRRNPDALVIGSDQILTLDNHIFSKAKTPEDAREKLLHLRGKTHHLLSAACVVKENTVLWSNIDSAALTMHDFTMDFLDSYMKTDPEALTTCVGAYRIEGPGAWLFSKVNGDYFTIMGMPLLPLLTYLHTKEGITP